MATRVIRVAEPVPARRVFGFSNRRLSTKSVERRRLAARIVRRFGQIVDVIATWVAVNIVTLAPALRAWADRIDADARQRQKSAAMQVLRGFAERGTPQSVAGPKPPTIDPEDVTCSSCYQPAMAGVDAIGDACGCGGTFRARILWRDRG
jgi:hypothetical protein